MYNYFSCKLAIGNLIKKYGWETSKEKILLQTLYFCDKLANYCKRLCILLKSKEM